MLLSLMDSQVLSWPVLILCLQIFVIVMTPHMTHPLVILSLPLHGQPHHWAVMNQGIKLINISALTGLILRVIHPEDAPQQYFNLTIVRTNLDQLKNICQV